MGSLAVPRESNSSLGSVFIIGTGGKKIERKVETLKTCRESTWRIECTRLSNAVNRHNCGRNTLHNPNKQPSVDMGSMSTWLSSLTEKPSYLPTTTPRYHTMKKSKRIGGKKNG